MNASQQTKAAMRALLDEAQQDGDDVLQYARDLAQDRYGDLLRGNASPPYVGIALDAWADAVESELGFSIDADAALYAEIEAMGFDREHNGGGTYIYRRGNVIVSGYDGHLPSRNWYRVGLYDDGQWCDECVASWQDGSAYPDISGATERGDIMADIRAAMNHGAIH